ncbi:MAG: hypothetical protein ABL892_07455 [Thiobacillaceae bacterium]
MKSKQWMMAAMSVAMLGAGFAQAESTKPGPGFDRVGLVSSDMKQTLHAQSYGPGEGHSAADNALSARKTELARRLVWLMLSAR